MKERLTRFLLISTHLAGLLGIGTHIDPLFVQLSPFSLMLSFGLLLWNHPGGFNRALLAYLIPAWCVGFGIEVAGVASGAIFGHYAYGEVLGPKVWQVPVLIGINWAMLVYAANEVAGRIAWRARSGRFARAALAAVLPVALDVVMEPVAIRTGMWHWYGSMPPLQNYIGWFGVSLLLSELYQATIGPETRNQAAPWLLGMQAIFFTALFLFLK